MNDEDLYDDEDLDDDDSCEPPLSEEEIADPEKAVRRLWGCRYEEALDLLQQAEIELTPQWPDHVVRYWDWNAKSWVPTQFVGPYIHSSWDRSHVIFWHPRTLGCPAGFEIAWWCDLDDVDLPPGWEVSEPWWRRHR